MKEREVVTMIIIIINIIIITIMTTTTIKMNLTHAPQRILENLVRAPTRAPGTSTGFGSTKLASVSAPGPSCESLL